jgi:hypothetical protein
MRPDFDASGGRKVRRLARALSSVGIALGALGCGGEDAEDPAFERVTLVSHPGGFGGAPAGPASTCDPRSQKETVAVERASRAISFETCHFEAPNAYTLRSGESALTEGELGAVEQALARLQAGTAEWACGPDAGFLTLDVQEGVSTDLYLSSSSCPSEASAGRTLASGIGDLWSQLLELSEN